MARSGQYVTLITRRSQPQEINALVFGASRKAVQQVANDTMQVAQQIAPRRTGNLAKSHFVQYGRGAPAGSGRSLSGASFSARVGNNARSRGDAPYALFVHRGTGVYVGNPMLRPKHAGRISVRGNNMPPYMKWQGWGTWSGTNWIARFVLGQRGNPWLVEAYNIARTSSAFVDNVRPMSVPQSQVSMQPEDRRTGRERPRPVPF